MISFFALYYGVIFENGDPLALNGGFMENAWVFLAVFRFFKTQSFKNFNLLCQKSLIFKQTLSFL
ncbi:hypothetical protein EXS89_06705 [Helicobacter pylori]|nr:hypothetical protein [Helicobacter pylori]WRE01628.1 hypothetical protein KVS19_05720 [Helicobacter pylori]